MDTCLPESNAIFNALVTSGVEHGICVNSSSPAWKISASIAGMSAVAKSASPIFTTKFNRTPSNSSGAITSLTAGGKLVLSYEDPRQDILIGLLRLRRCNPSTTFRPELKSQTVLDCPGTVRLRKCRPGSFCVTPVNSSIKATGRFSWRKPNGSPGMSTVSEKLAVIAGVGTRHYYRKLGYQLDGPYMSKTL